MELICVDEKGFRPVNNREARALIFTFGVEVGCFLIDIIKIEYDPRVVERGKHGRVVNDREIKMRSEYNPEILRWLGIFIHEATHIWQRETGCHRGGEGGKNYRYYKEQLPYLNLEREEHAEAVEDWFYVNYGIESSMINAPNQITTLWAWWKILPVFKRDPATDPAVNNASLGDLQYLLGLWNPVLKEIRDPRYLPNSRQAPPVPCR